MVMGATCSLTPSDSSTWALPLREVIARLPCLATVTPCGRATAAATRAAVVDMLKKIDPVPPIPQVSITVNPSGTSTGQTRSRITCAAPTISSTAGPRNWIRESIAAV